jgi:hypothetical protein
LIGKPFVAIGQADDATIGKAVLHNVVLHDMVVFMGIDADVRIMRKAEIHDVAEDSMGIGNAGNTMNHMIRKGIVCPFALKNL